MSDGKYSWTRVEKCQLVSGIWNWTETFIRNTYTEPIRERVFYVKQVCASYLFEHFIVEMRLPDGRNCWACLTFNVPYFPYLPRHICNTSHTYYSSASVNIYGHLFGLRFSPRIDWDVWLIALNRSVRLFVCALVYSYICTCNSHRICDRETTLQTSTISSMFRFEG